ncbi:YafY family protein [Novosphingobium sp. Fuku2-ISO-50]|uniref:helix-turn-helix transcriptional regulator n=1 Tax=Novosphingobium sp. Fuku2-ISO-50 TaxID=1739114 RepID=UPI00076D86B1|nr:YafY family protein [Novosphingobium sp. Fuku2-ISO-50]KUR74578.1 DNA-binding protein [Novosphingobium sp. Fuku2-ISO-50]
MRRTERLFRIIQILRGARRAQTGRDLAVELEVSLRTLYRDIAELIAQGVPVRGEAGTGYVLDKGYDLPPLMLTADELEAAVLGAAWVAGHGDPQLANGARDLIAKLSAIVPADLRPILLDAGSKPISFAQRPVDGIDVAALRRAIRDRHKVAIVYTDAQGTVTQRVIWPIFIAYIEHVRVIVAWCETRQDFRHFRTDRVERLSPVGTGYPARREALLKSWQADFDRKQA